MNGGVVVSELWGPDFSEASGNILGSISILHVHNRMIYYLVSIIDIRNRGGNTRWKIAEHEVLY
jgi:hypothetical protein